MSKSKQNDFDNLLAQLRQLDIMELLDLYIEAKTGSQDDIDKLPLEILDAVSELGELLNRFYGERVIDSVFKKGK